jgi:hypothetical protein
LIVYLLAILCFFATCTVGIALNPSDSDVASEVRESSARGKKFKNYEERKDPCMTEGNLLTCWHFGNMFIKYLSSRVLLLLPSLMV